MEFDTSGASAYAERCEYPPDDTFRERAARAVRLGGSAGGARGFFLVLSDSGVDIASHVGDSGRVNASLATLRNVLVDTAETLNKTCVGGWRIVVVGSHATGGESGAHRHHSPSGTAVPVFVAGRDEENHDLAQTLRTRKRDLLDFEEVVRATGARVARGSMGGFADPTDAPPRRTVVHRPDAPSEMWTATHPPHRHWYRGANKYATDESEVFVFLFFSFITLLLFCSCVSLPSTHGGGGADGYPKKTAV